MLSFSVRSWSLRRKLISALGCAILALALLLGGRATPVLATTISTPYLAMTVQAGQTVDIGFSVKDTVAQRLDLSVEGLPAGWKASILGGGRPVSAILTDPENPASLELQVTVPQDAEEKDYPVTVVCRAAGATTSLPITLKVSKAEGGTSQLTAEYEALRGPADATYTFSLTLKNSTLDERTYNISAVGPDNWDLVLTPSGQTQQTPTVSVDSKGSQNLTLKATPPSDVEIGTYELMVTAAGGGETVSVPLQIEITGTYKLTMTTPDGNLNAKVKAGKASRVQFVVVNSGTGPLRDVQFTATPPANWNVTFEPRVIDLLPPNQQQTVVAEFKPADNAIAGDYVVSMSAKADQATAQSDIRVTVNTSTLWGVVGVLIAIAAIAILGFVFRRYGHR